MSRLVVHWQSSGLFTTCLRTGRQNLQLVSFSCSLAVRYHSRYWKKSGYILIKLQNPSKSFPRIYLFIHSMYATLFNFRRCNNIFPACIEQSQYIQFMMHIMYVHSIWSRALFMLIYLWRNHCEVNGNEVKYSFLYRNTYHCPAASTDPCHPEDTCG